MDEAVIVEFRSVSFRYRAEEPWVLRNMSFTIKKGEWVGIIGHNGSGKSTIAKLMNGLLFATEGAIFINDKEVTETSIWDIREDVGMVFQNPENQFVGTTVEDDVAFGMENRGFPREYMLKQIEETLQAVGMTQYLRTEPVKLSGGQKQRVAIAGILAISPELLILDEATAMLDPKGREEIMQTIMDIQVKKQLSLITITHNLEEVTDADRILVINDGEIWQEASPRTVFRNKSSLEEIGLDVPFVNQLSEELGRHGVQLASEPLNQKELLESLWNYHSRT